MSSDLLIRTLRDRGIRDEHVLAALRSVPRDAFVPAEHRSEAWGNHPLPIGSGQTISQPYVVALMTELLQLRPGMRVLEIGTGCGYQAAILGWLGARVLTVERIHSLLEQALETLARLDLAPFAWRHADGWAGWPDEAPFERIIVAAAPTEIPEDLVGQLAPGGRLVIPVGEADSQTLRVVTRDPDGSIAMRDVGGVRFVPLLREPPVS